jgi:hypothetical protein
MTAKSGMSVFKRYGFVWVTLVLFVGSLLGHWTAGWFAFVEEQRQHNETPQVSSFIVEATRDTLENWQSEFLQLIWQVAGLAWLLHVGSPQSKEGDDRKEEKIDELLKLVDADKADAIIKRLDKKYPRT